MGNVALKGNLIELLHQQFTRAKEGTRSICNFTFVAQTKSWGGPKKSTVWGEYHSMNFRGEQSCTCNLGPFFLSHSSMQPSSFQQYETGEHCFHQFYFLGISRFQHHSRTPLHLVKEQQPKLICMYNLKRKMTLRELGKEKDRSLMKAMLTIAWIQLTDKRMLI